LSHSQIIKDQAYIARELSHFLGDAAHTFGLDYAYGETAQPGHIFRTMARAYAAAVFVIVPIDNVMATVFDTPVPPVGGKDALGVGLLRGSAGDAVGGFTGAFSVFFVCGFSLDDKSLSDVGKVEIGVEFGCGPDFADFDPAVIRRIAIDKIRFLPVFKVQGDVFKKTGLVVFDRKVVMSFTVPDQIVSDFALGQQGIGGNFFALNIDGIK
jgi:hypothetical protein